MAPSQVSGMKMRNLLFGVILGLLAVVHSTPVNTVTQNPSEAEDDFVREAMTDGFLIDQTLPTLLTTESLPKKPTDNSSSNSSTTQIPQSGVTTSPVPNETQTEESNISDGSGDWFPEHGDEHYTTTTQSVSHVQSTTSTVLPRDTDSDSSTTQIPQSGFTSSLAVNEAHSTESNNIDGSGGWPMFINTTTQSVSHGHSSIATLEMDTEGSSSDSSTTQIPQTDFISSFMLNQAQPVDSNVLDGSGTIMYEDTATTAQSSTFAPLPRNIHDFISDSSTTQIPSFSEGSGESTTTATTTTTTRTPNGKNEPIKQRNAPEMQNTAHSTPSWIIIVGFIVGVAALVMLCVAIATRDKWNGPSQASQLETNTNSSNQQRELEMETFLHKDNPRENGKAAEYTVIPLEELSESYSSH